MIPRMDRVQYVRIVNRKGLLQKGGSQKGLTSMMRLMGVTMS